MSKTDETRQTRRRGRAQVARRASRLLAACTILAASAAAAAAQQPDTLRRPRTRADSLRADSIARADSLAIVRDLERIRNEPRVGPGQQPANPRLLPDISLIGDLVADASPKGSTQEGGERFAVREVELAFGANVDPYFRADFILGLSDLEGIAIEEAYLTALALPWQTQARLGRFHMPIGKQNTTHRAELHTVEYPWVIQRYLGPEGAKGTGIWVSKVMSPFGFYQELLLTAVDRLATGEEEEEIPTAEPINKTLEGLGYSARLRNYWDLSQAANLEISASAATGLKAQPVEGSEVGVAARQGLVGVDVTFRWRPLQQGLYRSLILQGEVMRQLNERDPDLPIAARGEPVTYAGPDRDYTGAYVLARYQMGRRWYLGARFDAVQDPENDGRTLYAASGYYTFFPSEFSKLVAAFERYAPGGGEEKRNRVLLQATFAIGPHRPHPF